MSTTNKLIACLSFWLIACYCIAQPAPERPTRPDLSTFPVKSMQARSITTGEPDPLSIKVGRNDEYNTYSPEDLLRKIFVKQGIIENIQVNVSQWASNATSTPKRWLDTDANGKVNRNTGRGFAYFDARHLDPKIFPISEGLILTTANAFASEGPNSDSITGI